MSESAYAYKPIQYGFEWGPVEVTRCISVEGRGVVLEVKTKYQRLEVYVSDKGKAVRIFDKNRPHGKSELVRP